MSRKSPRSKWYAAAVLGCLGFCVPAWAQVEEPTEPAEDEAKRQPPAGPFDPYFLGYESEPGMDFAGRTVASLQSGVSRALGTAFSAGRRPALQAAWEFPSAAVLLLVQHEIGGHGGRAREFGLGPSYGFNFDLSAYTSTRRAPADHEELTTLAAGGAEADGLMAHRILTDLAGPRGADGAKIPLALMAKLDLTLYVFQMAKPEPGDDEGDFTDQSRNGNDMTLYLVSRQAQRRGIPAEPIWDANYPIDFSDPLLEATWDDARVTAVWNALDPSLVAAVFTYFREHLLQGESRVHARGLALPGGAQLLVGTRGALGPESVSRFLDFYVSHERGLLTFYVRDLDSSVERTWGAGVALRNLRLGSLELAVAADAWEEPRAREGFYEGNGWNASVEIDALFGDRFGFAAKAGAKSEGFFPGLPLASGGYFGLGVKAAF